MSCKDLFQGIPIGPIFTVMPLFETLSQKLQYFSSDNASLTFCYEANCTNSLQTQISNLLQNLDSKFLNFNHRFNFFKLKFRFYFLK